MPTTSDLESLASELTWDQPEGTELPSDGPLDDPEVDTSEGVPEPDVSQSPESPPPGDVPAPPSSPEPVTPPVTPVETPVTPTIAAPSEDSIRIRALESEKEQMEVRHQLSELETKAVTYRDNLVRTKGMTVENANDSARNWLDAQQRVLYDQYRDGSNRARDKELLAYKLSSETGTSMDELMKYDDPDSMKAHATNRKTGSAEVELLRKEVAALKKAQLAPAQKFDGGGGAGSVSGLERKVRDFSLSGKGDLTKEEYEAWKASR